jgi:hypothetical protein
MAKPLALSPSSLSADRHRRLATILATMTITPNRGATIRRMEIDRHGLEP